MNRHAICLIVFAFISSCLFGQSTKMDSLNKLSISVLDSNGIKTACRIAMELSELEPQKSVVLIDKLISKAENSSYYAGEAKLYNIKGICFDILSQYDSAIANYQIAYNIADANKLLKTKGSALNNLGMIYWNIGNYDFAIKNYLLALKQFEELNSENNIANATNNIGLVYADMKNYEEALKFYYRALALHRKVHNQYGVASVQTNIGIVYYFYKSWDKSASYLDSSIAIKREIRDEYGLAISLNHRADIFIKLKKYDSAKEMLLESTTILEQIGNKNMLFATYMSLSNISKREGDFKEAMNYTLKTLAISKEIGSLRKQEIALGDLSIIYEKSGNFEKAFFYLHESKAISDSILNIENFENINEMKEKYETEKKEKENLALQFENDKQKTKNQWIVFISIASIILVALSVWFFMYRRKQRLMKLQNIQLNDAVFETELQERERIARDLHDSVGQKLSVVKMQLSLKNADAQTASNLLDEAIQDVRNVSHNLMPADLSKGLLIALENMCEQINYSSTTLKVHLNNTEAVTLLQLDKQHTLLIYRMVQELVNNAIKYAKAKNIHINMDCEKNQLQLNLTDDGVGFDMNILKQKDGLGIRSIKERVQQLIGSMQLTSSAGKGTQFNISIPV